MLPSIFFGHGNPMNALQHNAYTEAWAKIGSIVVPRPKAVLCVSAHWYFSGATSLTVATSPRTIHDFGGFPDELFQVRYPAPGDPDLARRVQKLLAPLDVEFDDGRWGLDHGTWSVLKHVYPNADVPVVQLSIDASKPPQFHYDIGRRLAPLREDPHCGQWEPGPQSAGLCVGSGGCAALRLGGGVRNPGEGTLTSRVVLNADRLPEAGQGRVVLDSDAGPLPPALVRPGIRRPPR